MRVTYVALGDIAAYDGIAERSQHFVCEQLSEGGAAKAQRRERKQIVKNLTCRHMVVLRSIH